MKQTQLAKIAGITAKYVSDLKVGRRQFTIEMTRLFEMATGISGEKWAYPERHGDPWGDLKDISMEAAAGRMAEAFPETTAAFWLKASAAKKREVIKKHFDCRQHLDRRSNPDRRATPDRRSGEDRREASEAA